MKDNLFPYQRPIASIIIAMLEKNPNELNTTMAEEASRRLGKKIDRTAISDVRNRIGLGSFQKIEQKYMQIMLRAVDDAYKAGYQAGLAAGKQGNS